MSRLLESYGFEVSAIRQTESGGLSLCEHPEFDLMLVERDAETARATGAIAALVACWPGAVLHTDRAATVASLRHADSRFGERLARQIRSLLHPERSPARSGHGRAGA